MPRHAKTIRREISAYIEDAIRDQGVLYPNVVFPGDPCPLVNPLCPDDLCILPAGHPGTDDGYHVLGTTNYDYAERFVHEPFKMLPVGTTKDELIAEGDRVARELWPEFR